MLKKIFPNLYRTDDFQIRRNRSLAKDRPNEYQSLQQISLPSPAVLDMSLSDVLNARRSGGGSRKKLLLNDVSTVLHWSKAVTDSSLQFTRVRYPTAGGMNSLELLLAVTEDSFLPKGVYGYNSVKHTLVKLSSVSIDDLNDVFLMQKTVSDLPPVYCIVTARHQNITEKYGFFAAHLLLIEAGHLLQNMALTATAVGHTSTLYSFKETSYMEQVLQLPRTEMVLHTIALY